MPEGAVYVGRGSRWGNPFALDVIHHAIACGLTAYGTPGGDVNDEVLSLDRWVFTTAEVSVLLFRRFLELMPETHRDALLIPLRGRDLACWCNLAGPNGEHVPCHADVLLELANRDG